MKRCPAVLVFLLFCSVQVSTAENVPSEESERLKAAGVGPSFADLKVALDNPRLLSMSREIMTELLRKYPEEGGGLLRDKYISKGDLASEVLLAEVLMKSAPLESESILLRLMSPELRVSPRIRIPAASRLAQLGNFSGYHWLVDASKSEEPLVLSSLAIHVAFFWNLELSENVELKPSVILGRLLDRPEKSIRLGLLSTLSALARKYPENDFLSAALSQFVRDSKDEGLRKEGAEIVRELSTYRCMKVQEKGGQCSP